jgi:hypothetical protein
LGFLKEEENFFLKNRCVNGSGRTLPQVEREREEKNKRNKRRSSYLRIWPCSQQHPRKE